MENNNSVGRGLAKFLLVILIILLIGLGGYGFYFKDDIFNKENTDNNNLENNNEQIITNNDNENYKSIEQYLKNKYNENFEVLEISDSQCLEFKDGTIYWDSSSSNYSCDKNKVSIKTYKVKSNNNITFYVKDVYYDQNIIDLSNNNIDAVGTYDSYISGIVATRIIDEILPLYKELLGDVDSLEIYEGLSLDDPDENLQDITDKNISTEDFVAKLGTFEDSISIYIKVNENITKDNFKEIVSKFEDNSKFAINNLEIDNILVEYNNENRYIEYDFSFETLELKKGNDIFDSFNENVYDKRILFGDSPVGDGIIYSEFKKIDSSSFEF